MPDVVWFKEVSKESIPLVGGKGANLGEMINAGFPIPNGFIVTSESYFNFIKENNLMQEILKLINSIDYKDTTDLQNKTLKIRELIKSKSLNESLQKKIKEYYLKLGVEPFVAVRSSATAEDLPGYSFAGQQETFLNVQGIKNLIESIKNCWASLFTARATYYRHKNNFSTEKIGIAVVIQKMVNSESSGVMFTVDPTGTTENLVIESAFGLGEVVVGGTLTPDHYVVSKSNYAILEKVIAKQPWKLVRSVEGNKKLDINPKSQENQKISDDLITKLAVIGVKIEKHYNFPQDIEWAVENNELFIVQSRPITTLKKEKIIVKPELKRKAILKGFAASHGFVTGKVSLIHSPEELFKIKKGDVLVTEMTSPDMVPAMERAGAIITDLGGLTSHAAIVSRELGVPCIVGTINATKVLSDDELVTVDANNGLIFRGRIEKPKKIEEAVIEKKVIPEKFIEEEKPITLSSWLSKEELPEIKFDKLLQFFNVSRTLVKVNVAIPDAVERAAKTNADGVGLLRAEHMLTAAGEHPIAMLRRGEKEKLIDFLVKGIKRVLDAFPEKPVWYRSFDARTDEFRHLKGGEREPEEDNPMLGWHGIRRSLDEVDLLKAEFTAIKQLIDSGYKQLGIMFPFVQSVQELRKAKKIAVSMDLDIGKIDFGVMIETPAACWIIDELIAEGIDFISFGTNDLTQLTLGVDRNNSIIQKLFSELHPAVLRELFFVIEKCKKAGVKTSICGQAASNPKMIKLLVRKGIDSISANIDAVALARKTVLLEEKKIIMEKISGQEFNEVKKEKQTRINKGDLVII